MIRELRARHRRLWVLLAVVVPLVFLVALWVRPLDPTPGLIPDLMSDPNAESPLAGELQP